MSPLPESAARSPIAFFSYSRIDSSTVQLFAQEFRSAGVQVLLDVEFLRPGEPWENAIYGKLHSADALVFFVSQASLRSQAVQAELLAFGSASSKIIFPVLINGTRYGDLPGELRRYQALLVENDTAVPEAARKLAQELAQHLSGSTEISPEAEQRGNQLATGIAADIRAPERDPIRTARSVFLVHGHDLGFRDEVERQLQALGIQSVILSREGGAARSLFEKFERLASEARFAVVLMAADDLGTSRLQYEDAERGGHHTLKYRARQNVILELGFFYGRLGWENVFVLRKPPEHAWPDFEHPSDLAGAIFFTTSGEIDWRKGLRESLLAAKLLIVS